MAGQKSPPTTFKVMTLRDSGTSQRTLTYINFYRSVEKKLGPGR